MTKKTSLKFILSSVLSICILVGFVLYGFFRAQALILGPKLAIAETHIHTTETVVTLAGNAERASELLLNGVTLAMDPQGNFSTVLTPAEGYSTFTFVATDKFGAHIEEKVHVYRLQTPQENSREPSVSLTSESFLINNS